MNTVKCEVCHESLCKYRCPACNKRTCSLECSKKHKVEDNCTGKAYDPSVYLSNDTLKQQDDEKRENNITVQRDYNFLRGLKREVELKKRDGFTRNKRALIVPNTKVGQSVKRPRNGEECQRLIRRGVNCLLLPKGMSRSAMNRSKWDNSLDLFVWSVEWLVFPMSTTGGEVFKHVSHRVRETDTLVDGMSATIYEKVCQMYGLQEEFESLTEARKAIGSPAAFTKEYRQKRADLLVKSGVKFYMKWFPYNTAQMRDSRELIELHPTVKCIGEELRGRTVIEFPTIFVAKSPSDLPSEYVVIDESQKDEKERGVFVQKIVSDNTTGEPEDANGPEETPITRPTNSSDLLGVRDQDQDPQEPLTTNDSTNPIKEN